MPIEPGVYRVARGGHVRIATVTEADDTTLWVLFEGEERLQRLDECSRFCSWSKAEQSEVPEQTA